MAEAIVSFVVERLGELLISEAKLLSGVSDQINDVQRELKRMQCFLKEADKRQNEDERVRQWVAEIRQLAFKIEDVIETFAMEVHDKKQNSSFKKKLRRFAGILSEGRSRHNIATEINAIKADITNVTTSLQTYDITQGLREGETSTSPINLKNPRIFYSHDVEKDFVGMKTEMKQLISHLNRENTGWEVVSICGMGGQGKTTIAQKLFNHVELKTRFEAFAWVCISQQFDREKVLRGILKELLPHKKEAVSEMDDATLVKELYKSQQEKKCLIVIDDIWTVDSWRSLEAAFPVGETTSGSKILCTTRNRTLAAKIGSVHCIPGLTEEEGWQLLSKKAGLNNNSEKGVASEMERVGRNMVNKCKGLPLAISSLGGLLRGKMLRDWEKINKDVSFYLANDDEYYTVRQVLGLSYDTLPPHLRHCFLCFANYEEDEEIETDRLYMYWIAEGLVSVEDKAEGEMMLDVAERYLNELAQRSLVQVKSNKIEGEYWSKYGKCCVHDLVRDLCLSKVKEEEVIKVIQLHNKQGDKFKESMIRRLCFRSYNDGDESKLEPYDQHVNAHIRSLFFWKTGNLGKVTLRLEWPHKFLSLEKFKLLRVFTAHAFKFSKKDVESITKLVYLKYLCLYYCRLEDGLPSSIGNLRNLETLDLRWTRGIDSTPNVIWKLKQLKHLYLPTIWERGYGEVEKLSLKGLNELELIYNYNPNGSDIQLDFTGLPNLKIFHGYIVDIDKLEKNIIDLSKSRELLHSHIEIEGDGEEVLVASCFISLIECCFIDVLSIRDVICIFPTKYDHTLFSWRLTKLTLNRSKIKEDPMVLLEKIPNLRILSMYWESYLGAEMVCSAAGFPRLQQLDINVLPRLSNWRVEEGAMPNLSLLLISGCKALKMLPQGLRYLTVLEDLLIYGMPVTFYKRIQVIDGVEGEDFDKIRHVPNVSLILYAR